MKIAIIHAADHGGGAERSTLTLHQSLLAMGHDSHLYVGYRHLDEPAVSEIERIRTLPGVLRLTHWAEQRFGWQNLYSPGFRQMAADIESDTDLVHINSLWGSGNYADPGALPSLTRRFPTVMTLRDEWMLSGHCACTHDCNRWLNGCGQCPDLSIPPAISLDGSRFNWRRKQALLTKSGMHVTTVSDWLRRRVLRSPIFDGKQVSVVYNGIDTTVFKPESKSGAREKLGWPQDQFIVLMAGQTVEGIKQGIAQQAAAAVNLLDDTRVLPALVGHSASQVASTINRPSLTMPFQNQPKDMARCFQAADLTLVSSEVETFGRIAAESQACGTPVVTFSTGGLPEVVHDGMGGVVIERYDIQAFAVAVTSLLHDAQRLQSMSEAATKWALSCFANEVITNDYLSVYEKTIESWNRVA